MRNFPKISFAVVFLVLFTAGSALDIYEAVSLDSLPAVKQIMSSNPELLEQRNELGLTPFNHAAREGKLGILKYLQSIGADMYSGDREGSNALHNASAGGHYETAVFLIEEGFDVNARDDNDTTPLNFAVGSGNVQLVNFLLEQGADIQIQNRYGGNLIHAAVFSGDPEMVELFVDKGISPEQPNNWGVLPIHYAAWTGSLDLVKYFHRVGVDLNSVSDSGENVMMWALVREHYDVVDYLVEQGIGIEDKLPSGRTAMFIASKAPVTAVEYLLEKGAEVNCADTMGVTPLHEVAWRGRSEMIKYLLDHGADINARDINGRTALMNVIYTDSLNAVRILLNNGADHNCIDQSSGTCYSQNGTPLHLAAGMGKTDICRELILNGASCNFREERFDRTALHNAAIRGYGDIYQMLTEHGAEADTRDQFDKTPLEYARYYGNTSIKEDQDVLTANIAVQPEKNDWLNRIPKTGNAKITYTEHSGWVLQTSRHLLIFDYWERGRKSDTPSLLNGWIEPAEIKDHDVYVFVSHGHGDHYDESVFDWREELDRVNYIFGFEPETDEEYIYIPARRDTVVNDIRIVTIESNDTGVGFLLQVDGINIYHAGDHANRERDFSGVYLEEIDFLKSFNMPIDLAFMPISGCGFGDMEAVRLGVYRTLEMLDPAYLFPMHSGGAEYRYREFAEEAIENNLKTPIYYALNKGDRFELNGGKILTP